MKNIGWFKIVLSKESPEIFQLSSSKFQSKELREGQMCLCVQRNIMGFPPSCLGSVNTNNQSVLRYISTVQWPS